MIEWWSRRFCDVTTRQETTVSKGGFKAFRGSAATAESYLLERDTANLDDYYREGKDRVVEHGIVTGGGVEMGTLTPEKFRAWMEHRDPETDEVRGVIRHRKDIDKVTGEMVDNSTPLYQETILSVSKTLSLAAAANPRVAAALEAAMGRACEASAQALAEHAVTRIGAKGSQRYVKLDRIEFTSVQHTTSRAGDPHYHRHMQILPRGMVNGEWRSLDGRTLYRHAELVNSTADYAISTDAEFRQVLAAEGYSWVPGQGGGDITEFLGMVDQHSTRRDQIDVNREALEIEWRIAHPGQEPGPRQRQAWDTHAWAQDRPTKEPAQELTPEAMAELEDLHAQLRRSANCIPVAAGEFFRINEAFHLRLLQLAGNRWRTQVVQDLRKLMKLHRHHSLLKRGRISQSFDEHETLMAALRAGQAEGARRAMQAHFASGLEAASPVEAAAS